MERLDSKIERFLRTGHGDYDLLALELFEYQFEKNKPYHVFCQAQGRTPANVSRWEEIPAVPIGAFKSKELTTFSAAQAAAVFHSSATTTGVPSRHYLRDLRYYEAALKWGFANRVLPSGESQRYPLFVLTAAPGEAPHSSLVWMMDV